jgi:SNF2 family DNA or RNA helicase
VLVESVQDAVLNGHKVLVFTNFLAAVELLSADMEQRGIGHLTMTGATRNREALVRQFQARDDLKVFLMTLKTGGLGLNLTAAGTRTNCPADRRHGPASSSTRRGCW